MDYHWKEFIVIVAARNVQHALSCKKGGFVTLRHNELKDNIAEMQEEATSDVKLEPVNCYLLKKSKEISLEKLDLTFALEFFGLADRENSSTLGYSIPALNVTKVKPCENAMKLMNEFVHEF